MKITAAFQETVQIGPYEFDTGITSKDFEPQTPVHEIIKWYNSSDKPKDQKGQLRISVSENDECS